MKLNYRLNILLLFALVVLISSCTKTEDYEGYLFSYFIGNGPGEESIRFAVSEDGYNYRALNRNQPILDNKDICSTGGVRDPHILRGNDGNRFVRA